MSTMLTVFLNSVANGADNRQEELKEYKWRWPEDTYLQRRLKAKREAEAMKKEKSLQ